MGQTANRWKKGVATVGQGLVRNVEGLIATRFLLGLFEAGLFPGQQ